MKLSIQKLFIIGFTLLSVSNISFAGIVKSCETASDSYAKKFDYGDATGYGEACHATNAWQQLGESDITLNGDTGGDRSGVDNSGWSEEKTQAAVDLGDNGVQWRVVGTDNWGNEELVAGQDIEFKFVVLRSDEGNHKYDELKVWVDWNGNKSFEETSSEIIFNEKWYKNHDKNDIVNANTANNNSDLGTTNNSDTLRVYQTVVEIPLNAVLGDTWMRARIVCENSLQNHSENMNLIATGYQHQGEVEDYKLAINQVPEPTTLLVFASALFGLMLNRKKSA